MKKIGLLFFIFSCMLTLQLAHAMDDKKAQSHSDCAVYSKYQKCDFDISCNHPQTSCVYLNRCPEAVCITMQEACKIMCGERACEAMETYPIEISCGP